MPDSQAATLFLSSGELERVAVVIKSAAAIHPTKAAAPVLDRGVRSVAEDAAELLEAAREAKVTIGAERAPSGVGLARLALPFAGRFLGVARALSCWR